jgi:hypothetical protein
VVSFLGHEKQGKRGKREGGGERERKSRDKMARDRIELDFGIGFGC